MAKNLLKPPLMKQYVEMKSKHPDAVLLFRVGDFYETFSDDAIIASEILGITLTRGGPTAPPRAWNWLDFHTMRPGHLSAASGQSRQACGHMRAA